MRRLNTIFNAYHALIRYAFSKPSQKDIWLIGGHNAKLYTDNAKVFYEYMLEKHPEIEIIWVIDKNAPDYHKVKGRKVIKGSVANYTLFFQCNVALFSDTFNSDIAPFSYVLPGIRTFYRRCYKVYLSHGTISFKKMLTFTGIKQHIKTQIFTSYNMAVASTKLEVEVMHTYGIKKENIHLLGSARHDKLVNISSKQKTILIAPTWRPWLKNLMTLKETVFYNAYKSLLTNEDLLIYLKVHDMKIYFYLHHMFHPYYKEFKLFESQYVKILEPSVDIGNIIQSSSMLITDYSSISSDFYYLKKPILFFHFDKEEYILKVGSEIDLEREEFGSVETDSSRIVKHIHSIAREDFNVDVLQKSGEKFFTFYRDNKNCKRIYSQLMKVIR